MNFDNAYKKPLCRFSYLAAEQERYRTLSRTEMAAFLDAAAALQTEEGLIPLVIDKNMPSDCRVDLQYHPSYAAAAAAIYAWQTMKHGRRFSKTCCMAARGADCVTMDWMQAPGSAAI